MGLTVCRKTAKNLTVNCKSHHPIETLLSGKAYKTIDQKETCVR